MKLPDFILYPLTRWCARVRHSRRPDFIVGGSERPYLKRWYVTPWSGLYRDVAPADKTLWQRLVTSLPCIYVREFLRSDDDRALHDHPWCNCSIVLYGDYNEHTIEPGGIHVRTTRKEGDVVFRRAKDAHRVELRKVGIEFGGEIEWRELGCRTLFLTGLRLRDWGFHCPEQGFIPWRRFVASDDRGSVGKGCEG